MNYQIIFSKHALYQMEQRGLSKSLVATTILKPDKITRQTAGKFRAIKLITWRSKKYLMIVIFKEVRGFKSVITVFRTSKISKYL